jgi:hypothetical protein
MKLLVAVTTFVALLLGAYIGYDAAGVGGAIFYGALIGVGGTLLGRLLGRTAVLLRHSWKVVVATTALVLLAILTWGVYL